MKILITGGHLTPALSFIDYVKTHQRSDSLVFVGREFSQDALQQKAVERYEVEKRSVPFMAFEAVRLGPTFSRHLFANIRRFFQSITDAKAFLLKQKPAVVLSFGGYVAVPFALAAKQLRIPVVTHEQTLTNGFANKLMSWFATTIALTFPENTQALFAGKTVVTGNPLRNGVFQTRHPRPVWLPAKLEKPLILVMGGNQGSRSINLAVAQALPELVKNWTVVHQCGQPTLQEHAKETLERVRNRLPEKLRKRYFVLEWIDDHDLFWLYHQAFCALSRAGANSVQELAAAKVPSILIPLPSSRHNEQLKNAQWLARAGGAIVLDQFQVNTAALLQSLDKLKTMEQTVRHNLAQLTLPENAAEQLYGVVARAASQQ